MLREKMRCDDHIVHHHPLFTCARCHLLINSISKAHAGGDNSN
jgi:hypothetical protein